jgi:protocatechuate 3,4-dioxygenase beta subunit
VSKRILVVAAAGAVVAGGVVTYLVTRESAGNADRAGRAGDPRKIATTPPPPTRATGASAALARDDDPKGSLRLEGQVVDAADKPVASARVAIDSVPPREVVTEADGAFAFEGLLPRDYAVEATAAAGYAAVRLRLVPDAEPVTLRLAPAGVVEVKVTAVDGGAPVSGATVELRGTLVYAARTGDDGVATLGGVGPTWAPLVAHAPGYAQAAMMLGVSGDPNVPTRVSLALARGAAIAGKVVDDNGAPVAGARVHATSVTDPFPVSDPRRDGVTSGADGTFAMPAIAPGTWRLTATHDRGVADSAPLTVDGVHPRDGVVIVLVPAGVVRGTVVDAKGAPVPAADVNVVASGHVSWRTRRRAYADDKGQFVIRGLPRRAADVVAWHPSGASAIARVDLTATPDVGVKLVLDVIGAIAGTVVDKAGASIGDAQVVAEPAFTGDVTTRAEWSVRGVQQAITDQRGAFRFAGLPPGDYKLRATRPGASEAAMSQTTPVTAHPGDLGVTLVVPGDGRIVGKVALPDGTVPVAFTIAIDRSTPVSRATTDGAFAESVLAGTHAITVAGPGFVEKTVADVKVEEGKPTDVGTITVAPGRSVSGRVLDAEGAPVADAQVAAGRLLSGGGAELYLEDESIAARSTTTDADGRFRIEGLAPVALVVVAGKPGVGRSTSVRLPGPASATIDLVLAPTAGIEGKVTREGAPLGETIVIANPIAALSSNFFVVTGADGSFVLDSLAPDSYVVYPMLGGGGGQPKDMFIRKVDVVAGARARVEIDATPGPATLAITVTQGGAPVAMGMVFAVNGTITAATMEELRDPTRMNVFTNETVPVHIRTAPGGATRIAGVRPGHYTVCAAALAGPPGDPAQTPVTCAPVDVGSASASVTVDVPKPPAP